MTFSKFRLTCLRRLRMLPLAAGLWLTAPTTLRAATIQAGDVTNTLGPTFFLDNASDGGGDADINQPSVPSYLRDFNGLLTSNQGPTRVTLTGFGFATHGSVPANDATSVAVTFTYLGADELAGGGDDVVIGTATGTYVFTVGGEYVFAFDTPLAADLTITGTRFRIQIAPRNVTNAGSLKLKTPAAGNYEPKLSVAGFVAPLINPQRLNLAKFQPVTTSSVSGQRLASYVTDGVTGNDNRWESANWQWNTARVDFPFPVEVGSAQVFTGVDDTLPVSNFSIQYLDGSTWVTIPGASVSGNTNVERNLVFTNPVTASSFRIIGQDSPLRIRELALYPPNGPGGYPLGTDLTLNLAYQRPAVASANTAGNFALNAVDGRASAFMWQTDTAGTNTLDIDLRVSTKIGSAHLYSGSTGVSPLANFVLKYWDGSTWQNITGVTVAGNTTSDLVVPFVTPVTTSKVRLEFTNPGTTSIRELCIFPANTGNTGYPIGTNIIGSGAFAKYEAYNDAFYQITNPSSSRFIAVASGGQPALDQAGLTTAHGQYQVLLNLSTGTYRLRNRATGNCLSGAQLSKTPGEPLTDAPYSALPHQDWILDPLGGGVFQIINQWSGLVIDTQGGATSAATPLVQNTANSSLTQRWRFSHSTWYPKKGIGGTTFAMATNPAWAYNWGRINSQTIPGNTSFYPMQWGDFSWDIGSGQGPIRQEYPSWRRRGDGIHLLGFNEPDGLDQSNIQVNEALTLWPRLQELDQPLVSPAPAGMSNGWLSSFYTQSGNLGYRVDYTAVHTYPSPSSGSSDDLVNFVHSAYTNWQRPVWLTEFSFVDWSNNSSWSEEDCYNCLAEFLWRAESLTWLRKYALFVFTEDATHPQPANPWSTSVTFVEDNINKTSAPRSNSRDINGNLTAFGKLYAAWDCDATVRPDKTYYIHNKNTRKRMASVTVQSNPGGRNIRVDGSLVRWILVAAPTNGRYYMVSALDGRRLGSDGTNVSLVAAGTTGTAVEWSLAETQFGWHYLNHPASTKRLKMTYNNSNSTASYSMVTTTGDDVQWRFIVPPPPPTWSGASDASWAAAGNWNPGTVPATGDEVSFDNSSTANLNTVLNQNFDLLGVNVTSPAGPVSIGGTNVLTLGGGGIDLSAASQNLTITAPLSLSAPQGWNIAASRILALTGTIVGSYDIQITGAGKVLTGASNLLPNGASAGDLVLGATMDLNGTSQTINGLSGAGTVDNLAAAAASLTLANDDATDSSNTFDGVLQDTNGPLALIKSGGGDLTLRGINTHSGGTTHNGSGVIYPETDSALGSGPVVLNGGTLYAKARAYTFANALTLNGGTLRVGGGSTGSIAWTGPVSVTADSGISSDGSTFGITLTGSVDITGATFTSYGNSVPNTVSGIISGTGAIRVTGGTLNLDAANTFSGTVRAVAGSLKIGVATALQNATLDMNAADTGSVSLNNKWATIGALSGSRPLGLGSFSNVEISIGKNNLNTTYSGILSNSGSANILKKIGTGTLTFSGSNTYNSETRIMAGTLALGASNVLPATAVSIGNATLDAATFTDTVGTLDVTSTAKINLGFGAALAFANSSAIDWTGGALVLTGNFIPGVSLRFGTNSGGLDPSQLALISAPGFTSFSLTPTGYLTAAAAGSYDSWKTQITNGQDGRTQDADADGFTNLQEFLFGSPPTAGNGALVTTATSNGNLVLRWLQREHGASYTLKQSSTLAAGSWTIVASPSPAMDGSQTGAPTDCDYHTVTLPAGSDSTFFRVEGVEN